MAHEKLSNGNIIFNNDVLRLEFWLRRQDLLSNMQRVTLERCSPFPPNELSHITKYDNSKRKKCVCFWYHTKPLHVCRNVYGTHLTVVWCDQKCLFYITNTTMTTFETQCFLPFFNQHLLVRSRLHITQLVVVQGST